MNTSNPTSDSQSAWAPQRAAFLPRPASRLLPGCSLAGLHKEASITGPEVRGCWGPERRQQAEASASSGRRGSQRSPHPSCLWSDWVGEGHTSSHFYRCWHHTWGGRGPGWWCPNGLRLLPTFPDPQTPPPPPLFHSNTFTAPPPHRPLHLASLPPPSLLCLCFIHPSCLRANVISSGRPSLTAPSQSHALVALHWLLPCPYQTAITQPFARFHVAGASLQSFVRGRLSLSRSLLHPQPHPGPST